MIEFEDKAKATLFGVVKSVNDDITEIDFNHPLAGKNITFEVEIFKSDSSWSASVLRSCKKSPRLRAFYYLTLLMT